MKNIFILVCILITYFGAPSLVAAADIDHVCTTTCYPNYTSHVGTVTLILQCDASSPGSYNAQLTVNGVSTPVHTYTCISLDITATPSPINPGESSVLTWTVTNATTCTASGGWSGAKSATGGTEAVSPAITTSYSLQCTGPGGTVTRTVSVVVNSPVVTLTATPALIGLGDSATLTWTVLGATTCTASGGWGGAKSETGGTETVSPTVTTSYGLSCTGPSGTTSRTATVTLPSGFIGSTSCVIPSEGVSCNVTVVWNAYNFLSTPSVQQEGTEFSTLTASGGLTRAATPSSTIFTLEDTGSAFIATHTADIECASGSVWTDGRCVTLPVITIEANPNIIRSGSVAPINVDILANYPVICTLSGGLAETFNHVGSPVTSSYSFETRPLTAAQIVQIECVSTTNPAVTEDAEERVEVIPTIQEV